MSKNKRMLSYIITFCLIVSLFFVGVVLVTATNDCKYKDYQIDVYNNNVILYDNGNIVSKGRLDSLPQMIINDNL